MREQILKLRAEGKLYKEICQIVGCSKGTVSYYCGVNQKEKAVTKKRKQRAAEVFLSKTEKFKNRITSEKSRSFQRREGGHLIPRKEYNFSLKDVKIKLGEAPFCYLSGRPIDLTNSKSFHFDHIIPATKGGTNTLDNLGIIDASINHMKYDLSVEEFLSNCKEILEYNGYQVTKD